MGDGTMGTTNLSHDYQPENRYADLAEMLADENLALRAEITGLKGICPGVAIWFARASISCTRRTLIASSSGDGITVSSTNYA
jgi:hypothetical protein